MYRNLFVTILESCMPNLAPAPDRRAGFRSTISGRADPLPKGGGHPYFVSRRASTAPPVMPALSPSFDAMISTPFMLPGMA